MRKAEKIRDKTDPELETRLHELDEQMFKLRFQRATGALDNPLKIKEVRKEIARIKTIQRERQITEA